MHSNKYDEAKKMMSMTKSGLLFSKLKFDYINQIISNPEIQNDVLVKTGYNPIILCALIDTPNVAMEVKENALDSLLYLDPNISKNLLTTILFYGNQDNLKQLSFSISKKIVSNIVWSDFANEFNLFLQQYPNINMLPFANTNIEKCLFERVIKEQPLPSSCLSTIYEFIEYVANTKLIEDAIDHKHDFSDELNVALVNNKYISPELQLKLFETDIDMGHIKNCPMDKAQEFYNSIIYPLSNHHDFDYTLINTASFYLLNLIKHNLLPETCEIDLINRFKNNELHKLSITSIDFLLLNTNNQNVIKEILNITDPFLVVNVLENPNTSQDIIEKVINKFLTDTNDLMRRGTWSNWKMQNRAMFILSCTKLSLSNEMYCNLFNTIPMTSTSYHKSIFEALPLNAQLPQNIIDKLKTDIWLNDLVQILCYFNQVIKDEFSTTDAQSFLNTIKYIYDKIENKENIDIGENIFIPPNPDKLKQINCILNNSLKESYSYLYQDIVDNYKNAIVLKELNMASQKTIETNDVGNTSKTILDNAIQVIFQKIKMPYGEKIKKPFEPISNLFDEYVLYKQMIQYIDSYQTINKKIMETEKTIPENSEVLSSNIVHEFDEHI